MSSLRLRPTRNAERMADIVEEINSINAIVAVFVVLVYGTNSHFCLTGLFVLRILFGPLPLQNIHSI